MADRLGALLDRPLGPGTARAVLAFASAIFLGLAALFVFAASQGDPTAPERSAPTASAPGPAAPIEVEGDEPTARRSAHLRQDPQDIAGSAAARRAARALRSHRALQHVPYWDGKVRIALVGARGSRAVLRVIASTEGAARRGWHRFLRRYRDSGRAYVAVFAQRGRGDG
ncbi:MAG TPA: hypothetical protein VFT79_01075 [Solirubrobacterales bacterium]|nr:hypothetical protein [Solirubrobacterales bacterium]